MGFPIPFPFVHLLSFRAIRNQSPGEEEGNPNSSEQKNKLKIPWTVASWWAPPPPPTWIELPGDVTVDILQRLGAEEILESAQKVCTTWRRICRYPSVWRVIHLKNTGDMSEKGHIMCRDAVDRSQGQLIDLSLDVFGDDQLLNYIADRSSHLSCLTLNSCYEISREGLTEAVKKLPHLEELHLILTSNIQAGEVETIGISCPILKSFTFNVRQKRYPIQAYLSDDEAYRFDYNDFALAIANSMPNLRRLQLFAHWMKNEGLQAILDGCPHLESLDIRQCFDLDLGGDFSRRYSQQIKDLGWPSDSITDVDWLAGRLYDYEDLNDDDDDDGLGFFHDDDDDDIWVRNGSNVFINYHFTMKQLISLSSGHSLWRPRL